MCEASNPSEVYFNMTVLMGSGWGADLVGYFRLWMRTHDFLQQKESREVNVCMGGDWYTFPSHFFLPAHATLAYVEDNFHGLLPQPYDRTVGTAGVPLQPVNDLNAEERSRYVELSTCDYVVMTTPSSAQDTATYTPLQEKIVGTSGDAGFSKVHCEDIIDAARSPSALFRAYYVPFAPREKNVFMQYCLYSRKNI